jgi:ubiquinone/menaquinone biosynthesis C-methylase UbiE
MPSDKQNAAQRHVTEEARARRYYDAFSATYEAHRDGRDASGYHDHLDALEAGLVERLGRGREVLEVGCGTGLVLRRVAEFARRAEGVDLSPGMLEVARGRGLSVREGSALALPFDDASFDVVCAFKVLPHVPDLSRALAEMCRVARPGGYVVAELYNPWSFRGLAKTLFSPGRTGHGHTERDVLTQFHTAFEARRLAPSGARFVSGRGIRIVVPGAFALRHPVARQWLLRADAALADTALSVFAGFYVAVYRRG